MVIEEVMLQLENVFTLVYYRLIEIIKAPLSSPEMLWMAIPLMINLFIMEIYFGRYKQEDPGWNTAFENSLVLIFVSAGLIKYLYEQDLLFYINFKSSLVLVVVFIGLLLTTLDFFRLLPRSLAFGLSSKLPTNLIAYLTIIFVFSEFALDEITVMAVLIFSTLFVIMLRIIQFFIPEALELE